MISTPLTRIGLIVICLLSLSTPLYAQSQATTGNIEGRVVDAGGAVLPGVTITARNPSTGFVKTTTSDDEGNYRIIVLPPGRYTVTASGAKGFADATFENVQVTVGGQTPLSIQLGVAGIAKQLAAPSLRP